MAPSDSDSQLILLLGMHRSGSSALCRVLNALGAELPAPLLEPMSGVNNAGFWEDAEIVAINEALLTSTDRRWFDSGSVPDCMAAENPALVQKSSAHLKQYYSDGGVAVIKDPRMCRLLPFWLPVLRDHFSSIRTVIGLRHPMAVAESLRRRDCLPLEHGMLLWLDHVLGSLAPLIDSNEALPLIVSYEDLMLAPEAALARLDKVLDSASEAQHQEALQSLDTSKNHFTQSAYEGSYPALHDLCVNVYSQLRNWGGEDQQELHNIARQSYREYEQWQPLGELLSGIGRELITLSTASVDNGNRLQALGEEHEKALQNLQTLEQLGEQHGKALDTLRERDKQIAELQEELEKLGAEHRHALTTMTQRDDRIQDQLQELHELGQQHGQAIATVQERDEQLQQLQGQLQELGSQHRFALDTVESRDQQLLQIQQELENLGALHSKALEVVQQRDQSLHNIKLRLLDIMNSENTVLNDAELDTLLDELSGRMAELETLKSSRAYRALRRTGLFFNEKD